MADLLLNIRIKAINDAAAGVRAFKKDLSGLTDEAKRFGVLSTTSFRAVKKELKGLSVEARRFDKLSGGGRGAGLGRRGGLGAVSRDAKSAAVNLREVGRGMSDLGRASQRLIKGPVQAANQLQSSLTTITTLDVAKAIPIKQLRAASLALSETFGKDASAEADALFQAFSGGASDLEDAQLRVATANKLAVAGGTTLEQSMSALNTTTANFKKVGIDAAKAGDILFSAMDKGKLTIDDVARAFPKVASSAAAANIPIEDAAAAFAAISLTAPTARQASTQTASFLDLGSKRLSKQGKLALAQVNRRRRKAGLESTGISSADFGRLGALGVAESFGAQTGSKGEFGGATSTEIAAITGEKSARRGLSALLGNIAVAKESQALNLQSGGRLGSEFDKKAKDRAFQLERANQQLENAKIAIGEGIAPLITSLAPVIGDAATFVGEMAKDSPVLIKSLGALAIGAVGAGKLADGVISLSRAARIAGPLISSVAGKMGGLIGKLSGKAGMVGAVGAVGFAIGTFIDQQFKLSDKIAAKFAGTEDEKRVTTREAVGFLTERAVIRDDAGNEITDPSQRASLAAKRRGELLKGGTVKGDVSAALLTQGFTAKDVESSLGVGPSSSRRTGNITNTGQLDVNIKVDSDGTATVTGVSQSNFEGNVQASNGDGVAI